MTKIIQKYNKPANYKYKTIKEISSRSDKGTQEAILIALMIYDNESTSEKKLLDRVRIISIITGLYINVKEGNIEASDSLDKIKFFGGKTKYKSLKMFCLNEKCGKYFNSDLDICPSCGFNIGIMKKIKLTKEKYAIVDDEDFDFVKRLNPFLLDRKGKGSDEVSFHPFVNSREIGHACYVKHLLLRPKQNQITICKNKNNLDLRKSNLFIAGYAISTHRGRKKQNCGSIYKGVYHCKDKKSKRYHAYISYEKKRINLGYFYTEKDAARTYNEKAKELYGEVAYQNKL